MGCIASKKTETTNIELNEASKENTDQIGLTKRQRFDDFYVPNISFTQSFCHKIYFLFFCNFLMYSRFLLKGSWKGVSRELQLTGVRVFIK